MQNFTNWHALFGFLSHSVAVAGCSGIQRVDPQMIHFELFYRLPGAKEPVQPPNNICLVLGSHPKKIIIPVPFHSKAFVLLYKLNLRKAERYLAD